MPVGKPAPPRPRRFDSLTIAVNVRRRHARQRLAQRRVAAGAARRPRDRAARSSGRDVLGQRLFHRLIAVIRTAPEFRRSCRRRRSRCRSSSIIMAGAWSQAPRQTIGQQREAAVGVVSPSSMPSCAVKCVAQLVVAHDPAADAVADQDRRAGRPACGRSGCRTSRRRRARRRSCPSSSATSRNALVGYPAAMPLHDLQRFDADGARCRVVRATPRSISLSSPQRVSMIAPRSSRSSVHVRHHEIDAAEDRDQVRHHQAAA